jgi:hypothetical protein
MGVERVAGEGREMLDILQRDLARSVVIVSPMARSS